MDSGAWSLSPAFDMKYSYNPSGSWTSSHQMSLNGKCDKFELADFRACAKTASMKRGRAEEIVQQVQSAVLKWREFVEETGVPDSVAAKIGKAQRRELVEARS